MGSGFIYAQVQYLLHLDAFWAAAFFLLADFLTGVPRAIVEQRFSWKRFPIAFYKAALYFVLFMTLRVLFQGLGSGAKPFFPDLDLTWLDAADFLCIWLVIMREVMSILQNIQGGLRAVGFSNPGFDLVLGFLREKVFGFILDRLPGITPEQRDTASKALDEPEDSKS